MTTNHGGLGYPTHKTIPTNQNWHIMGISPDVNTACSVQSQHFSTMLETFTNHSVRSCLYSTQWGYPTILGPCVDQLRCLSQQTMGGWFIKYVNIEVGLSRDNNIRWACAEMWNSYDSSYSLMWNISHEEQVLYFEEPYFG